jgi:hypothetical protein
MNKEILSAKSMLKNTFKAYYPQWTDKEIDVLCSFLFFRFKNFIARDVFAINYVIQDVVQKLEETKGNDKIKPFYWYNSGFLSGLGKKLEKYWGKTSALEEWHTPTVDFIDNPDFSWEMLNKLNRYAEAIMEKGNLTTKERQLFEILIQVIDTKDTNKIYKLVKEEAIQRELIPNEAAFRKAFERLRNKLKDTNNSHYKNLLHSLDRDNTDDTYKITLKNTIEFMNHVLTNHSLSPQNYLKAYRLSYEECLKMNELLKNSLIDDNNKGIFKTERLPEIYSDHTHDPEIIKNIEENIFQITPDILGVYVEKNEQGNTNQGYIVLFEENIKVFSNRHNLNIDDVKMIVLFHELGHWIAHVQGVNIEFVKTQEGIAQFIAYLSCKGNTKRLEILENLLTPSNSEDPYALYKKLMDLNWNDFKLCEKTDIIIKGFKGISDDSFWEKLAMRENEFKDKFRGAIAGSKLGF